MQVHTNTHDKLYGLAYPVGHYPTKVKRWARHAATLLDPIIPEGTALVCRGASGAILATALNMFLERTCTIVHVKKPGEKAHHRPCDVDSRNVLLVDDFIESGKTMQALVDFVRKSRGEKTAEVWGILLGEDTTAEAQRSVGKLTRCTILNLINVQ